MRNTPHMNIFPDATQPLLGFLGATVSGAAIWVAQAAQQVPPEAQGWIQLGGTIGLIGCLSYACKTLWTELQTSRKESADLNKTMRDDWKYQQDKLISVLEKLDKDAE